MSPNDADPTTADAPTAEAPLADEAAAAPKRRRAPRKKVEAAAAEGALDSTPLRSAVDEPAAAQPSSPVAEPVPPPAPLGASGEAPAAEGVESMPLPGAAPSDGAQGAGAGGRRGRNRRRGRRGGDRGPRPPTEAAPDGEDAAASVELPRPPAPDVGEVFAQVLSGAYDAEPAADEPEAAPARRVLAAEPDAPKLHKVLAQAGVGSRRDLEQMIMEGRITVNGEPAHIGQRISFGDRIAVGGKPVRYRIAPPPARVLAYHKPAGEVVSHDDPQQRPTVFRRLPRLQQGKWQSVGRLDINTEGLLLFTNSGELANQLMHPRFGVEREYAVRSLGLLDDEAKARLLEGVEIDGQRCAFERIDDGGGEGANHWYRCVISEGRNREVRRLFEAAGHAVSRLIRIRYGPVVLPRGLKRGVWVDLDEHDVRTLRRAAGGGDRANERGGDGDGERRNRRGGKRGREGAPDRGPRGPRPDAGARVERGEDVGPIPNPLQQTFDKRAIQQERALRREIPEDGPIPNPLQQTYDKRALQRDRMPQREIPEDGPIPNPLQQTYDKRFAQKPSGFGPGGSGGGARGGGGRKGGPRKAAAGDAPRQPDPMQTSLGYIGGDAFLRKGAGGRGRPRKGGGGGRPR